jgi:DNA-binding transcriptional LysR family regulator
VRALARGEFGELQVGYVPPLDFHILPRALAEFQKLTPGVKVVLRDLGSDDLCRELRAGTLHLALMMRPSEELIAGIEFEEIGRYPFFVAMAPGHALTRKKAIALETLAQQPLVVLDRRNNSEFHRILRRLFSPRHPQVAVETDSVNSLITEIGVGRCVGVVSQLFKEAIGRRLVYRPLLHADVAMCIGLARARHGDFPPAGEKLCATIRKLAQR